MSGPVYRVDELLIGRVCRYIMGVLVHLERVARTQFDGAKANILTAEY